MVEWLVFRSVPAGPLVMDQFVQTLRRLSGLEIVQMDLTAVRGR